MILATCVTTLGLSLGLASCTTVARWGRTPLQASRAAPPSGVAATALVEGARLPPIALEGTGGHWSRPDSPTLLLFYRGDW
jgi:hypothetical protein